MIAITGTKNSFHSIVTMELISSTFIPCQGCLSFPCIRWAKTLTWHCWSMELTWWFLWIKVSSIPFGWELVCQFHQICWRTSWNRLQPCGVRSQHTAKVPSDSNWQNKTCYYSHSSHHDLFFHLCCQEYILYLSFGVYLLTLDDGVKRFILFMFLPAQPSVDRYSISERDC